MKSHLIQTVPWILWKILWIPQATPSELLWGMTLLTVEFSAHNLKWDFTADKVCFYFYYQTTREGFTCLVFLRMTIIYMWWGTKNDFMGKERWLKCVKMQFSTASHITELKYTTLLTNCTLNCHHKGQGFYSSHFFVCFRNTFGLSLCLLETEMPKPRLL